MKTCPFCKSKAEYVDEFLDVTDGQYIRRLQYLYVACTECGSSSKRVHVNPFCDFSKYYAHDFRLDPDLRPREDIKYKEYAEDLKKSVIKSWDRRMK